LQLIQIKSNNFGSFDFGSSGNWFEKILTN